MQQRIRFCLWCGLFTLGAALIVLLRTPSWGLGGFLMCSASFPLTTTSEWRRPLPRSGLLVASVIVLMLAAIPIVSAFYPAVGRVIYREPHMTLPLRFALGALWLLAVVVQWQRSARLSPAQPI